MEVDIAVELYGFTFLTDFDLSVAACGDNILGRGRQIALDIDDAVGQGNDGITITITGLILKDNRRILGINRQRSTLVYGSRVRISICLSMETVDIGFGRYRSLNREIFRRDIDVSIFLPSPKYVYYP